MIEDITDKDRRGIIRSDGRHEVTYHDLYARLTDIAINLTVVERFLLAAMIKEFSISKDNDVEKIAYVADLFIDLSRKFEATAYKNLTQVKNSIAGREFMMVKKRGHDDDNYNAWWAELAEEFASIVNPADQKDVIDRLKKKYKLIVV